ncbi:hypothetical protein Tco_0064054 [Tanacetum coccineum]
MCGPRWASVGSDKHHQQVWAAMGHLEEDWKSYSRFSEFEEENITHISHFTPSVLSIDAQANYMERRKIRKKSVSWLDVSRMLLALMDEGADSESYNSNPIISDPLFLELLKDENDGLVQSHWTSPRMKAALQAAISSPSDRLKHALKLAPRLLDVYFSIALH